jgi:hydroxymethylbilane synthase
MADKIIKIGTRGGRLALAQTEYIIELLKARHPNLKAEAIIIKTSGDEDVESPLQQIGGVGVFARAIEKELLGETVDAAVHSAKDLPSIMTDGLAIGAVPPRENCADVWISGNGETLTEIAPNSRIGTGSPRRRAQILRKRPDLRVVDIRGNVETRLRKLDEGQYDALVMAYCGLKRAGLEDHITEILPPERFIPAPGQGALAVQIREDDEAMAELTAAIDDAPSHRCLDIERSLLRELKAGCSTAVGAWARFEDDKIRLTAMVLDRDGKKLLYAGGRLSEGLSNETLISLIVEELMDQGAAEIIAGYNESQ